MACWRTPIPAPCACHTQQAITARYTNKKQKGRSYPALFSCSTHLGVNTTA